MHKRADILARCHFKFPIPPKHADRDYGNEDHEHDAAEWINATEDHEGREGIMCCNLLDAGGLTYATRMCNVRNLDPSAVAAPLCVPRALDFNMPELRTFGGAAVG